MTDHHKKSQLNVRIPERLHARINVMKEVHGFTVSEVFEQFITQFMDALPEKPHEPLTIAYTKVDGKWMELWFYEMPGSYHEGAPFHRCTKSYKLLDAIESAGLMEHARNFGLIGIQTFWEDQEIVRASRR